MLYQSTPATESEYLGSDISYKFNPASFVQYYTLARKTRRPSPTFSADSVPDLHRVCDGSRAPVRFSRLTRSYCIDEEAIVTEIDSCRCVIHDSFLTREEFNEHDAAGSKLAAPTPREGILPGMYLLDNSLERLHLKLFTAK